MQVNFLANSYYAVSSLTVMGEKFGLAGTLFRAPIALYKLVRRMISCHCFSPSSFARSDALMSDIVPELPDDILMEILGRLPVSSIFHFRSVSRSFRSLVVESHTCNRLPPVLVGVFCVGGRGEISGYVNLRKGFGDSSMDYNPMQFLKELSLCWVIMDSKFGLILCKKSTNIEVIYVCNPVTRKCRPIISYSGIYDHFVLAFDPSRSNHHYEVIKISQNYGDVACYIFEVFSSKTGRWDRKFTINNCFIDPRFWGSCFVSGLLYMLFGRCVNDLAVIDCADGSRKRVALPSYNQCEMAGALCNSYGCLTYSEFYRGELRVWSLLKNENGPCWRLRHEINLKDRLKKMGFIFPSDPNWRDGSNGRVMLFHLDTLVLSISGKRFLYNLESDQLQLDTSTRCNLLPWSPSYHAVAGL